MKRRLSWYKFNGMVGFVIYGIWINVLLRMPIQRRYHTDIFSDTTESGKYVRETVKFKVPKVWGKVSEQLYDLGYQFPEMNEVISGDFPATLIENYQGKLD